MNLLEIVSDVEMREQWRCRRYGVVVGIVSNNQDPDGLGRVKVKFPWLAADQESNWARVAAPMAGKNSGITLLPKVDDEVLVAFENGDPCAPYVVGGLWNGKDTPPSEKGSDNANDLMVIKSRSGHLLIFSDRSGSEQIQVIDKTGRNKITIDSASNKFTLEVGGDIELKASAGKIVLDAQSVEIKSSAAIKVTANSTLELNATSTLTVKGQLINLN